MDVSDWLLHLALQNTTADDQPTVTWRIK